MPRVGKVQIISITEKSVQVRVTESRGNWDTCLQEGEAISFNVSLDEIPAPVYSWEINK
jgi:hypothetical protein